MQSTAGVAKSCSNRLTVAPPAGAGADGEGWAAAAAAASRAFLAAASASNSSCNFRRSSSYDILPEPSASKTLKAASSVDAECLSPNRPCRPFRHSALSSSPLQGGVGKRGGANAARARCTARKVVAGARLSSAAQVVGCPQIPSDPDP